MPPFRRTRLAPERSGERLIDPPVHASAAAPADSIETLVDNNRLLRTAFDTRIGDLKLWELVAATQGRFGLTLHVDAPAASTYLAVAGHRPDGG
jgi:hypothetical protein